MKRKAHIRDLDGNLLYNRLWNIDGENVMPFDSPGGFIAKDQCRWKRWTICGGWATDQEMEQRRQELS